jgi:hypothetical protein
LLGHAIPVDPYKKGTVDRVFFFPHHGVTSVNKLDKFRVVFKCSVQHDGISHKQKLLKGPNLLKRQVAVLLRFHQFQVLVARDIEKMYHQVQVPAKDPSAFRFSYQVPGINEPIKSLQMTRNFFGAV